jgi:GNAT superfamily N-acetyltransferase
MTYSCDIRLALEADAFDIAELIYHTSVVCCFSAAQPCPKWYEESVQANQIVNLIKSKKMVWLVAIQGQKVAGVLAVSDKSHVKYFFVHPMFQKLGVGKSLWDVAMRRGALGNSLTVRSSLFAVPVYQRLGFKAIEPPKTFNGIDYQTMVASNC